MFFYIRTINTLFLFLLLSIIFQSTVAAANIPFTSAYTTLSNSRFSFKGAIEAGGISAGADSATIKTTGQSDNNTGNIFNDDTICINTVLSVIGCANNTTYTINNVPSSIGSQIYFTPAFTGTAAENDRIISTQSGTLAITFRPQTELVSGDKLILTLVAASSAYNDGIPDSTGFDSAKLPADLASGTGCAAEACFDSTPSFNASAVALTSAANLHTITITLSSTLLTSTDYSFVLGHISNPTLRFLNPSPNGTAHVRGSSDSYSIRLLSKDSTEATTYNDTTMKINPVDGVFVSANVELSLTYKINEPSTSYVDANGSLATSQIITECNGGAFTTGVATNSTSIPFGSISSFDTFRRAAQTHYVQTNATNGYTVTVQYDNALKKAGVATTILDGTCDGTCTADTAAAWGTSTNNGFGYTLGNVAGSAAKFTGTNFKTFSSSAKTIMEELVVTSGSRVAMCYQLSVDAAQETGFYYNKLTYIATPKF